jgi:hypothetical protein
MVAQMPGRLSNVDNVAKKTDVRGEGDDSGQSKTVGIPSSIYDRFAALCDRRGMKMRTATGRVLAWLVAQEKPVQTAVLGVTDGMEASYIAVLEALVKELKAAPFEDDIVVTPPGPEGTESAGDEPGPPAAPHAKGSGPAGRRGRRN